MNWSIFQSIQKRKKFILLFGLIFLTATGFSIGANLLYSLILINYGAKAIPGIILGLGVTELTMMLLFSANKTATKKTTVLNSALFILIGVILLTYWSAVRWGQHLFFILGFVGLQALSGIIIPQIDMVIANLFSVAEFKNVYPKISSAYSISSITGGLILMILSSVYGVAAPLFLVGILFLLAVLTSGLIYRVYSLSLINHRESLAAEFKKIYFDRDTDENILSRSSWNRQSWWLNLRAIKKDLLYIWRDKILIQIIGFTLLAFSAYRIFSYLFDYAVNASLSVPEITPFFALLEIVVSVGGLLYRLFVSTTFIKRVSFTRGYWLQALVMSLGASLMITLFGMGFGNWLYGLCAFLYVVFQLSIINRETSENIAYSLVPRLYRDKTRTLVSSIGDAMAYIVSASLILGLVYLFNFEQILCWFLGVSLIYWVASFFFPILTYRHIRTLLVNKHHEDLMDVIQVVGERRGRCLSDQLIALFHEQSARPVREKIISTLGDTRSSTAYQFLLSQFLSSAGNVSESLIKALAQYRKNQTFLLMYLIYVTAPTETLRTAITYLWKYNKRKVLKLITADLLFSKDDDLKILALNFLGHCRQPKVIQTIRQYARETYPVKLVQPALQTLYTISRRQKKYVINRLTQMLHSKNPESIKAALHLIGYYRLKEFKKTILLYVDHEADLGIRDKSLYALMNIDAGMAVHYFVYYLTLANNNENLVTEFVSLAPHLRMQVMDQIVLAPVPAVELAIKHLLPHRTILHQEIEALFYSISQRFLYL